MKLIGWISAIWLVFVSGSHRLVVADEAAEEQAFKQATALAEPSIVRIETVGGTDVIGDWLAGSGPTTGVVVGADGWIITNSFHFASNPASVLVVMPDGARVAAKVHATDHARRLTLLKVDGTNLTPLKPCPKDEVRVGQWGIALGRTLDAGFPSISVGIISAKDRVWGKAFQTDAKTSPVNYGGPLVDVSGRGIGVIAPLSPQGSDAAGVEWYDSGIGFAVPLEDVYRKLEQLQRGEDLKAGLLGITFADAGLFAGDAVVKSVRRQSPAAEAGILARDQIIVADGKPISRVTALKQILGAKYAGESVALTVRRREENREIQVKLVAELPAFEHATLGILPMRSTPEGTKGVEVRGTWSKSAEGLAINDLITGIDGETVETIGALREILNRHRPGEKVTLQRRRGEQTEAVTIELNALESSILATLPLTPLLKVPEPAERPKTGRLNKKLPGTERSYWLYVPDTYRPGQPQGLVVWLHSKDDPQEGPVLGQWKAACDARGFILVGPHAEDEGWNRSDQEFVKAVMEVVRSEYRVDDERVCLVGRKEGGRLAWSCGQKHPQLIRGVVTLQWGAPGKPPELEPEHRQLFLEIGDPKHKSWSDCQKMATALTAAKYPHRLLSAKTELTDSELPADLFDELIRWIDSIDRL